MVGLDPMLIYMCRNRCRTKAFGEFGETLEGAAEAIWQFNKEIVDKTCDLIPAVKASDCHVRAVWRVRVLAAL